MHSATCRTPPPLTPLTPPTPRRNLAVAETLEIAALDRPKRKQVAIGQSVDVALTTYVIREPAAAPRRRSPRGSFRPFRFASGPASALPEAAPKPEHPRRATVTPQRRARAAA